MATPSAVLTRYVSAACNRVPHCAQWGTNGLLAFGTHSSIALYDTQDGHHTRSIQHMVPGHTDRVNCVHWIQCPTADTSHDNNHCELVSGSSDNTLRVWDVAEDQVNPTATLTGHTGTVTAVDSLYIPNSDGRLSPDPRTIIASASGDSTVRIWERKSKCGGGESGGGGGENGGEGGDVWEETQVIPCVNGFALAVALCVIPSTSVPILAIGRDDGKVYLYTEKDGQFSKVQTLVGHEDWIRGLQFAINDSNDLLLASCSQDCLIRIWRIPRGGDESGEDSREIRLKENCFSVMHQGADMSFAVTLESIMAGHENWVYGVHWQPPTYTDSSRHQEMCLLSASMDKTMIVWKPDMESGIWLDQVRVGEVGGNTLGLYGCQFSPDGLSIMAHGFQGALHMWTKATNHSTESQDVEQWVPEVTVGGHFDGVQDLDWEPEGRFLVSVSQDQTTRLHAEWCAKDKQTSWHEIARPQVHGYDMQCIAMIGRFRFVAGADEKVLRVFDAPRNFLENLSKISHLNLDEEIKERQSKAEGASVPALGLSNKAVFSGETGMPPSDREITHPSEMYPEIYFAPLNLNSPPTEEHLLQNTLWPETQKLYGHGFEVFCVAAHPAGTMVASACKASKAEYASIIIWDTQTWHQICQLGAHSLTVTQMSFSHSGQHLLAVSRDRTWSLFHRSVADAPFQLAAKTDKKTSGHSRIIWSCSWSHDDKYFATASRDKKVIVWGQSSAEEGDADKADSRHGYRACSIPLSSHDAVTAVDFAPCLAKDNSYILAIGLESGHISIHKWNPTANDNSTTVWQLCVALDSRLCHTSCVKRLKWRPNTNSTGKDNTKDSGTPTSCLQFASCSSDNSVRIHNVDHSAL